MSQKIKLTTENKQEALDFAIKFYDESTSEPTKELRYCHIEVFNEFLKLFNEADASFIVEEGLRLHANEGDENGSYIERTFEKKKSKQQLYDTNVRTKPSDIIPKLEIPSMFLNNTSKLTTSGTATSTANVIDVGIDNNGNKLFLGDTCKFKFKGKEYEGTIVYDSESFSYAFEMVKGTFSLILMSKADCSSITKIAGNSAINNTTPSTTTSTNSSTVEEEEANLRIPSKPTNHLKAKTNILKNKIPKCSPNCIHDFTNLLLDLINLQDEELISTMIGKLEYLGYEASEETVSTEILKTKDENKIFEYICSAFINFSEHDKVSISNLIILCENIKQA